MPQSIYDNGGFIGKTLDFGDTDRYVITPEVPPNLQYVGGLVRSGVGTTSNFELADLGDGVLTGGIAATPSQGDLIVVALAFNVDDTKQISFRIRDDINVLYTQIADIYSVDTEEVQLQVGYKFHGASSESVRVSNNSSSGGGTADIDQAYAAVIHVWRGVDPSTPLDVAIQSQGFTNTGIPNPPAITPVTTGSVVLAIGASGHDGGVDTFTSSDLSNFRTAGGDDTHDVSIGMGSIAWTGGAVDPAAFGWTQSNSSLYAAAAVTLALRPTFTPAVLGNQKNSGIWSLSSVLESIESVSFTHIATVETANTGGTVSLSGYQVGDVAIALRYGLNSFSYTVSEPGTGWTSAISQYVPSSQNAAYDYDFSWNAWYKVLTSGDLSSGAAFQTTLLRNFGTVLIFRPSTTLSSVSLVRAESSHSPTTTAPSSIQLLSTSDLKNVISIAQTSYGTGTNSYAFTGPAFVSNLNDAQGSTLYSHYRIATTPENNTLTSGGTASAINVLFGLTLQGNA